LAAGGRVSAYDPEAMENARQLFGSKIELGKNNYDVLSQADALAIVTEWSLFRNPDFTRMKGLLRAPLIFDGRNLYDLKEMKSLGFSYFSVGRPGVSAKG
jgi:UDPglucose 6-dehydrogenase